MMTLSADIYAQPFLVYLNFKPFIIPSPQKTTGLWIGQSLEISFLTTMMCAGKKLWVKVEVRYNVKKYRQKYQ